MQRKRTGKTGKRAVRRAVSRLWPKRKTLTPREEKLVDGIITRERAQQVQPQEFRIDASNAIHRSLASRFGLRGEERKKCICLADGYTAAKTILKSVGGRLWRVKRLVELIRRGKIHLQENTVKRLLEDVEIAHRFLGEGWEARHDFAELDRATRGKSIEVEVSDEPFEAALREILGENFKPFMKERKKLMKISLKRWRRARSQ